MPKRGGGDAALAVALQRAMVSRRPFDMLPGSVFWCGLVRSSVRDYVAW